LVKGLDNLSDLGTRAALAGAAKGILGTANSAGHFPGLAVGNENTWFSAATLDRVAARIAQTAKVIFMVFLP
jgi:hypothetical protein